MVFVEIQVGSDTAEERKIHKKYTIFLISRPKGHMFFLYFNIMIVNL